jgi:hypothetical protein
MKNFLITGVKFLFFTPVALLSVAVLYFFYCEANKAYWDYRVKEMCLKDGGVTVYEKVKLTKEERNQLRFRDVSHVTSDDVYYSEFDNETIKNGTPEVFKMTLFIYRNNDQKLLGKKVTYGRRGGDFPSGIAHPSSYSCNQIKGLDTNIELSIFTTEGDQL